MPSSPAGAGLGDYVMGFFAPTLLGNVIGGVSLVAFLNHAPLGEEGRNAPGDRLGRPPGCR